NFGNFETIKAKIDNNRNEIKMLKNAFQAWQDGVKSSEEKYVLSTKKYADIVFSYERIKNTIEKVVTEEIIKLIDEDDYENNLTPVDNLLENLSYLKSKNISKQPVV